MKSQMPGAWTWAPVIKTDQDKEQKKIKIKNSWADQDNLWSKSFEFVPENKDYVQDL